MNDPAKVKPLDLSTLLRHAFLSGRGLTDNDKLSDEDQAAWCAYDPSTMNACIRITGALYGPATWQPIEPEGWFLHSAANEHTPIIYNGDKHKPLPDGPPWRVAFQCLPHGGRLTWARGKTFREAWENACAVVAGKVAA